MSDDLAISIQFSEVAARMLPPTAASFDLPPISLGSGGLSLGDYIRFDSLDNCPWFVVAKRFWNIGANGQAELTLWLDAPED